MNMLYTLCEMGSEKPTQRFDFKLPFLVTIFTQIHIIKMKIPINLKDTPLIEAKADLRLPQGHCGLEGFLDFTYFLEMLFH